MGFGRTLDRCGHRQNGVATAMSQWIQTLLDGLLGALLSSLITIVVAIYVIQRSQQVDRTAKREDLSLAAAERLTLVMLEAGRRLDQLSDQSLLGSRISRTAAYQALASDLRMATNLHAPVLSPVALAGLPQTMHTVLDAFVAAITRRELTVMQEEGLKDRAEDDDYALDRAGAQLRQQLSAYLNGVTDALTVYRQGRAGGLPSAPAFVSERR
jgi:hypothetical protein